MASSYAVTDSHALIWAAMGRANRLGRSARRHFERAVAGHAVVYIPTLVFVEIGESLHLGRLTLDRPFPDWITALLGAGPYLSYELTPDVVRAAERLRSIPERGDRLIAATAVDLDCPLITRDSAIAAQASVERLWD